jgi:ABC-type multidrug transport system fused ATPase/permease subunit
VVCRAGATGLVLTYAITLTRCLSGSVRTSSQLAAQMSTVERVLHFAATPAEDDAFNDAGHPPPASDGRRGAARPWPDAGCIKWKGVVSSYARGDALALDNVWLTVEGGSCLGVCGRTGAGKSSLLLSLLRVLRCQGGMITIDGCDISCMPLRRLRSSLAVIPQDPVQIAGSVRQAVDPSGHYSDTQVLDMLRRVGLTDDDEDHDGGSNRGAQGGAGRAGRAPPVRLETELKEGGVNLSTGQRQLLCLARALLAHKKIVALDESTAHIDEATARKLRRIVLEMRGEQTVLIIAHRLHDIAISDRVAVMEQGRLAQHGAPLDLLHDAQGAFCKLVDELDAKSAAEIRALALEAAHLPQLAPSSV